MQFLALLTKEIKLLFKNWLLLLISILVPVLAVIVSYVANETSVINVTVGYVGSQFKDSQIQMIQDNIGSMESMAFSFSEYKDTESLERDFNESVIDSYIVAGKDNEIDLFYDSGSTKGELAGSYLYQAVQIINSNELYLRHSDIINAIEQARIFEIRLTDTPVNGNKRKLDPLIKFGFIWIFLYSTLNNAITQIQQEKMSRTILYLIKAPISPLKILLTKQAAVLLQFFIMVSCYIAFVSLMGMYRPLIGINQILAWIVILFCISSMGHTISLLINNSGVMVIMELVLVFPVMLADTLQTTLLDKFIKIIPTFGAANMMAASLEGNEPGLLEAIYLLFVMTVCYCISYIIMKKRDAVGLCDTE